MKSKSLPKLKLILFIFLLCFSYAEAQDELSIGGYVGGGIISGFSSGQGSFTSSLFIEADPGFLPGLYTRFSFVYARDFRLLLGEKRKYFPFVKAFAFKGIIKQFIQDSYYLEEGLGLIAINDRTFNNVNEWNFGLAFSLLAGIDLRKMKSGFKLGLGLEYGLTFSNTFAKYFSLHFQTQYVF